MPNLEPFTAHELIQMQRLKPAEIMERIARFQMVYITEGVAEDCDLKNISLENMDFATLCREATYKAVANLRALGRDDEIECPAELFDDLANHLDLSDCSGRFTSFKELNLTNSEMRNTYFIEPDFRHASQFMTLDVSGAHWVRPKFTLGAQLAGLSISAMDKMEEPEFYDHDDKQIKGAYLGADGRVHYDQTIGNVWDNARRGVDAKGALDNYNSLMDMVAGRKDTPTHIGHWLVEQTGRLLP